MSVMTNENIAVTLMSSAPVAYITIRNNGGYVARFHVSFDYHGASITKESGSFSLGVNKTIEIPSDATNIRIVAEEAWFINSWSNIFNATIDHPMNKSYEIYGTTLNPKWKEC